MHACVCVHARVCEHVVACDFPPYLDQVSNTLGTAFWEKGKKPKKSKDLETEGIIWLCKLTCEESSSSHSVSAPHEFCRHLQTA